MYFLMERLICRIEELYKEPGVIDYLIHLHLDA